MLPDADVAGLAAGVRDGDVFGHRGLTHSLLFAPGTGLLVARIFSRNSLLPVGSSGAGKLLFTDDSVARLPSLLTMAICALLRQRRIKERSETD